MTAQTVESCGARWVGWGRGKFHIQPDDATTTVCGLEIPEEVRTSIYGGSNCARCVNAAPDLAELAEKTRKALYEAYQGQQDDVLERNRRGEFIVYRCRKCGRQHRGVNRNGPGVPYCLGEHHEAELEAVKVQGPKWEGTA